jgi:hypothetical protein
LSAAPLRWRTNALTPSPAGLGDWWSMVPRTAIGPVRGAVQAITASLAPGLTSVRPIVQLRHSPRHRSAPLSQVIGA